MRLIDADALIERLKKDPLFPLVEQYGLTGVIETQPTADTLKELICSVILDTDEIIERIKERGWEPVEHGRWLHGREVSRDYIGDACVAIHYEKWWCSECHVDGRPLWKFCPNCGARNEVEK